MVKLVRPGQAGTMESNDIFVIVAPADAGTGRRIELTSPVIRQYGRQITSVIAQTLADHGLEDVVVNANDKGALDCTIRARLTTAIARAAQEEGV